MFACRVYVFPRSSYMHSINAKLAPAISRMPHRKTVFIADAAQICSALFSVFQMNAARTSANVLCYQLLCRILLNQSH